MKILFICDEYPPGAYGGIGTFVRTMSTTLVKTGHQVFVAGLCAYEYGGADYEVDEGVRVWRKRYGLNAGSFRLYYRMIRRMPPAVKGLFNRKREFAKFVAFVQKLVKDESIEVIEVPDFNDFTTNSAGLISWPDFGAPLVVKIHGSYSFFRAEAGLPHVRRYYEAERALLQKAHALAAVSTHAGERTKEVLGLQKEFAVLYNGIEPPPDSNLRREDDRVVFTGTLVRKKGIYELFAAWQKVHARFPHAKLIVCGKGARKKMLEISGGASRNVFFMGHLRREQLRDELAKAAVACFPSHSETFGLGVVEAMAAGCAVIYMKKPPGPEIVNDGKTGILVDASDIGAIEKAILDLLSDSKLRSTLAENGRLDAHNRFDINKAAGNHLRYYSQVIAAFRTKANGAQ
jgi:glycogen synthase